MSFSIFGIAINKNYENNFEELQKGLGWQLKKESIIDLETASENRKEEGIVDVYFSQKGTLLFLPAELMDSIENWFLRDINQLTFSIDDNMMHFLLKYYERGILKRSIMDFDGELIETGAPFSFEEESDETMEIILELIKEMIEIDLWEVWETAELEKKVIRYKQI